MKRIQYLHAWRRRFGFQYGLSSVAVKEYISRENAAPDLSFVVDLTNQQTIEEIKKLIRREIHRRISKQKSLKF